MHMRTWVAAAAIVLALASPLKGQRIAPKLENVSVPPGYFLHAFVTGLDFPTAVTFSPDAAYVAESGAFPGFTPKVKRITADAQVSVVLSADQLAAGQVAGPLTDVTYHDGWLYITHRQIGANGWLVGAVSRFRSANPVVTFQTLVSNLPSAGDHHTDEIVLDATGRAYLSLGTATNSSVVGPDNWFITGWLQMFSAFHGFPAVPLILNGTSFVTPVPFPLDPQADDVTAPYMPFGSGPIPPGTIVPAPTPTAPQEGIIAGNGAIYSFDPNAAHPASTLRLEAWGLRNPFGLGLDPFDPGVLFTTNNGADIRTAMIDGQLTVVEPRPIANDWDDLFRVRIGGAPEFFGFPDYFHDPMSGTPLPVEAPIFCAPAPDPPITCPSFVLDASFRESLIVAPAFAQFELHSSANKFDTAVDPKFRFTGDLFVAETGAFVPVTGARQFSGYKVVRVDRGSGVVHDFIVNTGETPEEIFDPASFNKPIDVKFLGELMFIVDFGVFEPGLQLQQAGTGKVWLVAHGKSGLVHFLR